MGNNNNKNKDLKQKKKNIPPILSNKPVKKTRIKERSDQFRAKFQLHLQEKKKELEKIINYLKTENSEDFSKVTFDSMIDELDRTDREMAAQNYYKFLDRKKNELSRIEVLIDRVKHDRDFGICEECERPIPEARLMIVPETVLCVACQQELEKLESRTNFSNTNNRVLQYKDEYEQDEEPDNIDDAGLVTKAGTETMSLMDMEEIDLVELPETPDEEEEPTPQ